jgi:hypothetical protein
MQECSWTPNLSEVSAVFREGLDADAAKSHASARRATSYPRRRSVRCHPRRQSVSGSPDRRAVSVSRSSP